MVRSVVIGAITVVTAIGSFSASSWLQMTQYSSPIVIQTLGFITLASLVILVFLIIVLIMPFLRRIQLQFPIRLKPTAQVSSATQKQQGPRSPLWIAFDEDDSVCVDKRMVTINARPKLEFIKFRVLVHNRSDQTIERVRVLLALRNGDSLPVPLRFLRDQSDDGTPSIQGFDMDPHTKEYVNVLFWNPEHEGSRGLFILLLAGLPVEGTSNTLLVADSPHGIDLTARARNVPPYTKQFNLHMDDYGIPRFQRAAFDATRPDEDQ